MLNEFVPVVLEVDNTIICMQIIGIHFFFRDLVASVTKGIDSLIWFVILFFSLFWGKYVGAN
jgi:hypothetical protein